MIENKDDFLGKKIVDIRQETHCDDVIIELDDGTWLVVYSDDVAYSRGRGEFGVLDVRREIKQPHEVESVLSH